MQPLDDDARRRMVRGLLARNVAPTTASDGGSGATKEAEPAPEQGLDRLVRAMYDMTVQPPAWLEAATLTVTPEEMTFIEGLAPLLGTTPRSVKRFVNVFQLIKTIAQAQGPVDHASVERLLFLLAVSTGPPETARDLFRAVEQATPSRTLATVVKGLSDPHGLDVWLDAHPPWRRLHVSELKPWLEPVRRFWFRAGAGGPATAPVRPAAGNGGAPGGP